MPVFALEEEEEVKRWKKGKEGRGDFELRQKKGEGDRVLRRAR